jgi:hypothetical protein
MDKLYLLSGLVAPLMIALLTARLRRPRRALRRTVILFCLYNVAYVAALVFLFQGYR